jgi:hypothetical protein
LNADYHAAHDSIAVMDGSFRWLRRRKCPNVSVEFSSSRLLAEIPGVFAGIGRMRAGHRQTPRTVNAVSNTCLRKVERRSVVPIVARYQASDPLFHATIRWPWRLLGGENQKYIQNNSGKTGNNWQITGKGISPYLFIQQSQQ